MTTANEMLIKTLCKDGCTLNTSTFSKAAGTVSHTTLTGITASAGEINKLVGAGAIVASGTQAVHAADLKANYVASDIDDAGTIDGTEVAVVLNLIAARCNALVARLEAFGINASA